MFLNIFLRKVTGGIGHDHILSHFSLLLSISMIVTAVLRVCPPFLQYFYTPVLPKPPFRFADTSSSTVIPNSVNSPWAIPLPAGSSQNLSLVAVVGHLDKDMCLIVGLVVIAVHDPDRIVKLKPIFEAQTAPGINLEYPAFFHPGTDPGGDLHWFHPAAVSPLPGSQSHSLLIRPWPVSEALLPPRPPGSGFSCPFRTYPESLPQTARGCPSKSGNSFHIDSPLFFIQTLRIFPLRGTACISIS